MKRIHLMLFCTLGLLLSLAGGAQAGTQLEKNLKLAPGGTLYVDTSGGDVIVKGTSESGARVLVTSNLSDLESIFALRFEEQPHAVEIVAHRRSDAPWPHHFTLKFEISVPRQTSLELKTGGGDVSATDLEGAFHLKTSGGDVEASDVKGDLDGQTSGGDMRIHQLSGNLVLHTSGGDIQAEGISGRVDVHTSGGDVEVSLMRGNAQGGEVETSGGEISVALDPVVNLDLEASAGSGDVESDLHVTTTGTLSSSNLRATLGKGGQLLRLHTSGGDIHLRPL
jgi:hypothetical protein